MVGLLDLDKLRGALINAGLGADKVSDAAIFAQTRLNAGADLPLALWCAIRDVRRRRRAITQRDYLRWGSCSAGRGVGVYLLADGSRVRYTSLLAGEIACEVSRESDPAVLAAVSELEGYGNGSC